MLWKTRTVGYGTDATPLGVANRADAVRSERPTMMGSPSSGSSSNPGRFSERPTCRTVGSPDDRPRGLPTNLRYP